MYAILLAHTCRFHMHTYIMYVHQQENVMVNLCNSIYLKTAYKAELNKGTNRCKMDWVK